MYEIDGYIVAPSKKGNFKYDVFKNQEKVVSFGDKRYKHYKDQFGYYSDLNHNDKQRLTNFRNRFAKLYEVNKNNPKSGLYWSWKYLW